MQLLSRPYHLLIVFSLLVFLSSFFPNNIETLDFFIHDTVFILTTAHLLKFLSAFLLGLWLIYNFTYNVLLSKAITWVHVLGTLLFILCIEILYFGLQNNNEINPNNGRNFQQVRDTNFLSSIIILLFLISQILFMFNIVAGLIKFKAK